MGPHLSRARTFVIVVEMFIGSINRLGHNVHDNQMLFDMPRMYTAMFGSGALGYGFKLLFILIERRHALWFKH